MMNFIVLLVCLAFVSCNSQNNSHKKALSPANAKKKELAVDIQQSGDTVNVKNYGAKGDGTTDDSKSIKNAIAALHHSNKKILYFPSGVYLIKSPIRFKKGAIQVIGASAKKTILKSSLPFIFDIKATKNLKVENIQFNGSKVKSASIRISGGSDQGKVEIKNCIFRNAHLHNIRLVGANNTKITSNIFRGIGNGRGTGIYISKGSNNIHISDNKFLYLRRGVYIVGHIAGSNKKLSPNTNIYFESNYLDFGWYLLPSRATGKGKGVTYTKNSINNPNADFKKLGARNNVRVLHPLHNGTISLVNSKHIKDSQANFVQIGIRKHDLVRIGNSEALVDSVIDRNTLAIEDWLNKRNLHGVKTPEAGKHYSIYRIVMAKIRSNTKHKIKVWKFYNFHGNEFTPTDGWRYEVLKPHPDYPFFASVNNHDFTIKSNVFKKGWADQISIHGDNALITGNTIMDGQDMGITLEFGGKNHTVTHNTIIHQRTGVIFDCDNSTFSHNKIIDCEWATDYGIKPRAYIYVRGKNDKIHNNIFKRNKVRSKSNIHSIIISGRAKDDTQLLSNKIKDIKTVFKH